ncbi:hypothetical protein ABZ766_27360 [Streptomyces sp. NPDC006670]|uniref:hypothetical protein n=1 Tax=Streptomyces sp. NPDC006670 TaxID=3154476 RepID=UPI00340BE252
MRISRTLTVLFAIAALATACTHDEGSRARQWEPDDALQRAQRALDADDADTTQIAEASVYLASGIDRTLDTPGNKPYRFDIACDTDGVSTVNLSVTRGANERHFEVRCGNRQTLRLNLPAGPAFTVRIPRIDKEPIPSGVIVWNLNSLEPNDVRGCPDDIKGCKQ